MAQFILDTSELDTDVLGPIVFATASSDLLNLNATATSTVTDVVGALAELGSLVATANVPTSAAGLSGNGGKFNFVQPNFTKVVEPETKINIVSNKAISSLLGIKSTAISQIDFSIMEDDAEVLLLI
jgi:hypothetical protein